MIFDSIGIDMLPVLHLYSIPYYVIQNYHPLEIVLIYCVKNTIIFIIRLGIKEFKECNKFSFNIAIN